MLNKLFRSLRELPHGLSSVDVQVARAVGIVLLFGALAAVVSAGKEMALAWRFGVSEFIDVYQFMFAMAQWPLSVVAAIYTVSLIPLAVRIRSDSIAQASKFRAEVLGLAALSTLPLSLGVYFGLHFIANQAFTNSTATTLALAQSMALPMTLVFAFGLLAVVFGAWIMARGRHTNTLLQAVPAGIVLIAILAFEVSAPGLLWSTAAGFALFALASYLAIPRDPGDPHLSLAIRSDNVRTLLVAMTTLIFGQVLISFVTIVDQWFAAKLGTGALSTLGYTNRVVGLILSLLAIAISRGILPVISRVQVDAPLALRGYVMRYAVAVFTAGLVLAVTGYLLSDWLVRLLFERGEFLPEDTATVAELVRYAMFQVPFYLTSMVVVSALFAQSRHRAVTSAAAANGIVKFILAYVLVDQYGLPGLLLATAAVYLMSTIVCALYLMRRLPDTFKL